MLFQGLSKAAKLPQPGTLAVPREPSYAPLGARKGETVAKRMECAPGA